MTALQQHPRMTTEQFVEWAVNLPDGERYELVAGEVVAMAPERAVHARAKLNVVNALANAIRKSNLPCEAFPDGMSVRIDLDVVYEPDALVRCGGPLHDDAIIVADPVVVVEVLSPSTRSRDTSAKLEGYFHVPTLRHYLIVQTETREVIHHRRDDEGGGIATRIVGAGVLELAPPGLRVEVAELFP